MNEYMPTSRCLTCECPVGDHIPLRYTVRAWFWHRFHRVVERFADCTLGRIPDTTEVDF